MPRLLLVAQEKKYASVLGFIVARFSVDESELENIAVSASSRRKGIALQLVNALASAAGERQMSRIFLEVRESNYAARALYEKCGFTVHGCRRSYYRSPIEDAVLYARELL